MTATNDKQEAGMSDRVIEWDDRCIRIAKSVTHPSYGNDKRCKILDSIQIGLDAAKEEGFKECLKDLRPIAPEGTSMKSAEEWKKQYFSLVSTIEHETRYDVDCPDTLIAFIQRIQQDALASRPSEGTSEDEKLVRDALLQNPYGECHDGHKQIAEALSALNRLMSRPNAVIPEGALQDVLNEISAIRKRADENNSDHNFKVGVDVVRRAVEHLMKNDKIQECPHASPFKYCPECVIDPCPIGLPQPPKDKP